MQKRLESLRVGPPGLVRVSSLVRWLASLQAQLLRVQGAAGPVAMGAGGMAKAKSKQVVLRLMSQAGTGYYYTFRTTLKGVREKCAHYTAADSCTTPATSTTAFLSPRPLAAATASCTNATTTLRRYRHLPCHRYRHPHPPPAPPPSPPPIAYAHHRRLRPRHHRCHGRPRHHRPRHPHRPHRTVPVPPHCTARPHCNPRRSSSSPAHAPRPTRRLQLMKHDPVVNKHVLFKEERIKK